MVSRYGGHGYWDSPSYPTKSTNYAVQAGWLADKKATAELEAHRERSRQAFSRLHNVKSSEWVQGLIYLEAAQNVEDLKKVCNSFGIAWKAEGDMKTKLEEIQDLKDQIKRLNSKLEKVEYGRWGKEPANGSVFKIERRFEAGGKGYTYAAVRAEAWWYITGTRGDATKALSWAELQRWAGKYSRVWKMTVVEELVD